MAHRHRVDSLGRSRLSAAISGPERGTLPRRIRITPDSPPALQRHTRAPTPEDRRMTPATAIILSLILSIVLIVFGLGLRTTMEEALWLFRRPLQLFKALLAIYVVVPAFAIGLCLAFDL